MKTIKEVFSSNLRKFRGDLTQFAAAELAKIPFRTYQNAELGHIPQSATLKAIAQAFGVPETELFLDPDLTKPTPEQALKVLDEYIRANSVKKM